MAEVHCWASKGEWLSETFGEMSDEYGEYITDDGPGETCMLLEGHDGPHEWTPNNEIIIQFSVKGGG